jgi:hypothetical protein
MAIKCKIDNDGNLLIPTISVDFSPLEDLLNDLADKGPSRSEWYYGDIETGPAAATELVKLRAQNADLEIRGFMISAGEANEFELKWVNGGKDYEMLIPLPSAGSIFIVLSHADPALNEGREADQNSEISISVVNTATAGIRYQAGVVISP